MGFEAPYSTEDLIFVVLLVCLVVDYWLVTLI